MLNLYISFAPDDTQQFVELLKWLKPLEEKYYLRVWYNRPAPKPEILGLPWSLLLFWYKPPPPIKTPYHPDLSVKAAEGHVYLFLTSPKWISTPWVNEIELPVAIDRHAQLGNRLVRICPVQLIPSDWTKNKYLAGFKAIGPEKALSTYADDEGYKAFSKAFGAILEEVRRNWIEETHFQNKPVHHFYTLAPAPKKTAPIPPLFPNWLGWLILAWIMYAIMNWYGTSCSPNRYEPVHVVPPFINHPEPFRRGPLRPPPDSVKIPEAAR
jgi:hypothetical protein